MMKYTEQDIKELVEMYYGDYINSMSLRKRNAKGSDSRFRNMKNFLKALDDNGYEIIPKERAGCGCGRSE